MINEELNAALYEKMSAEQDQFVGRLLKLAPEEMLEHSFEYTVRQDILISMEDSVLNNDQTQALFRSETPLADVYKEYQKQQSGYIDVVRDSIVARANSELRKDLERQAALRSLPVYPHSGEYAREHGELEQYRESRKANISCRAAIEDAIKRHYRENRLDDTAVKEVVDTFGYDRTLHVLAATVQQKDWDGRISRDNKEWAKSMTIPENRMEGGADRNIELIVGSHSGLMNLFLTEVRRSLAMAQSKEKSTEKERPSMLARLRQQTQKNAPKHSAKSKEPDL